MAHYLDPEGLARYHAGVKAQADAAHAQLLESQKALYIQQLKDLCLFAEIANADDSGGDTPVTAQAKSVTPLTTSQVVRPDEGYTYLSQVTVNPIPYSEEKQGNGTTVNIAGEG